MKHTIIKTKNANAAPAKDKAKKSYQYIPSGCKACGGPYPHCKTSCPLFDD